MQCLISIAAARWNDASNARSKRSKEDSLPQEQVELNQVGI